MTALTWNFRVTSVSWACARFATWMSGMRRPIMGRLPYLKLQNSIRFCGGNPWVFTFNSPGDLSGSGLLRTHFDASRMYGTQSKTVS